MSIRWQPASQFTRHSVPPKLLDCLLHSGSLTRYLDGWCDGQLNLHLLGQAWQKPLPEEARALDLVHGHYALVREITLNCDNHPWIYGRSVFPRSTLTGSERRLAYWGQRSLGSFLFADKNTRRGRIEIACIRPGERLHQLATGGNGDTPLWGRRSIFSIKGKPLLVVEIFLDNVISCMNA